MAAAANEQAGSVVGAEEDKEVLGTVAAAEEQELDDEILRFMDSMDSYLLLMDSLSSALRQGWLDLAGARHSMGPSRISNTLFDHKEQSAATKLQVTDCADLLLSEPNPHFALSKWGLQEKCHSRDAIVMQERSQPKLRYRGSTSTPEGHRESDATTTESSTGGDTTSSDVQRARLKALSVFGALVPPKLRTAQDSFETALDLIVDVANTRSTLLHSFLEIKRKSKDQAEL